MEIHFYPLAGGAWEQLANTLNARMGSDVQRLSALIQTDPAPWLAKFPSLAGQLNALVRALRRLEWAPGENFRVVTVSIDHRDPPRLAADKRAIDALNK